MCNLQIKSIREMIKSQINSMATIALSGSQMTTPTLSEVKEFKQSIKTFMIENFYSEDIKLLGHYLTNDNILFLAIEVAPGGYVHPHKHDMYEKVIVLSGSYTDEIAGETFSAGDRQILVPGMLHSMRSKDGCIMNVIRSAFQI